MASQNAQPNGNDQLIPSSDTPESLAVTNHGKLKKQLKKAFDLRFNHKLSYSAIGKQIGVTRSAVFKTLKPFEAIIKDLTQSNTYTANSPEILGAVEFEIIRKMVDEGVLKKATFNNLAYGFDKIHNARTGKKNVSATTIVINVEQVLANALRKSSETDE